MYHAIPSRLISTLTSDRLPAQSPAQMARRLSDDTTIFSRLMEALDAAAALADELRGDRLFWRLVSAFRLMPAEDRPVVVDVVEREVKARRISYATHDVTGQVMHPNRHARLYVRSHQAPVVPRDTLERDEMMLAMLSALRVVPILATPEIHASWVDATREAIGHLDADTCRTAVELLREVIALATNEGVTPTDDALPAGDGQLAV
jgi:hypothetical protein